MIDAIYNYREISSCLATSGQPDSNQLLQISKAGYEVVINLGLLDAEYSVPNEKELIESNGMQYIHIPVNFETPEINKYFEFATCLKTLINKKVFIHCAANKRVSVFLALFSIIEERIPYNKAIEELKLMWEPNDTWIEYMKEVIKKSEITANQAFNIDLGDAAHPSAN